MTTTAKLSASKEAPIPGLEARAIAAGVNPDHFKSLPRNNALAESFNLMNGKMERDPRV